MDYTWALNQTAVYWERGESDGYGDYDWEDPVEVSCRWVEKNERFLDLNGEEKISKAKVLVNQEMSVGDYLYLGSIDDLTSSSDPANTEGAYPIRQFDRIPDIFGEEFLRRAWL